MFHETCFGYTQKYVCALSHDNEHMLFLIVGPKFLFFFF